MYNPINSNEHSVLQAKVITVLAWMVMLAEPETSFVWLSALE